MKILHLQIIVIFILCGVKTPYGRRIRCPPVSISNGSSKVRTRGRVIAYKCHRGFSMFGEPYAACYRGKWDPDPPVCLKPGCTPIDRLKNGQVVKRMRSALLEFSCNSGYKLLGPSFIYCNGRKWNNMQPYCKAANISCNFEEDNPCSWTIDMNDDDGFMWHVQQQEPIARIRGTGPKHDHTFESNNTGHYLMIETSDFGPSTNVPPAKIHSPKFPIPEKDNSCFIFWYHMFGSTIGKLSVFLNKVLVFDAEGNHGDRWIKGVIPLHRNAADLQLTIEGTNGGGYTGDIGLDDFSVVNGSECLQTKVTSCKGRCEEENIPDTATCRCNFECYVDRSCCKDYNEICIEGTSTVPTSFIDEIDYSTDFDSETESRVTNEYSSSERPLTVEELTTSDVEPSYSTESDSTHKIDQTTSSTYLTKNYTQKFHSNKTTSKLFSNGTTVKLLIPKVTYIKTTRIPRITEMFDIETNTNSNTTLKTNLQPKESTTKSYQVEQTTLHSTVYNKTFTKSTTSSSTTTEMRLQKKLPFKPFSTRATTKHSTTTEMELKTKFPSRPLPTRGTTTSRTTTETGLKTKLPFKPVSTRVTATSRTTTETRSTRVTTKSNTTTESELKTKFSLRSFPTRAPTTSTAITKIGLKPKMSSVKIPTEVTTRNATALQVKSHTTSSYLIKNSTAFVKSTTSPSIADVTTKATTKLVFIIPTRSPTTKELTNIMTKPTTKIWKQKANTLKPVKKIRNDTIVVQKNPKIKPTLPPTVVKTFKPKPTSSIWFNKTLTGVTIISSIKNTSKSKEIITKIPTSTAILFTNKPTKKFIQDSQGITNYYYSTSFIIHRDTSTTKIVDVSTPKMKLQTMLKTNDETYTSTVDNEIDKSYIYKYLAFGFCVLIIVLGSGTYIVFIVKNRRKRMRLVNDSEGELLYTSSEEMLDFNLAIPSQL